MSRVRTSDSGPDSKQTRVQSIVFRFYSIQAWLLCSPHRLRHLLECVSLHQLFLRLRLGLKFLELFLALGLVRFYSAARDENLVMGVCLIWAATAHGDHLRLVGDQRVFWQQHAVARTCIDRRLALLLKTNALLQLLDGLLAVRAEALPTLGLQTGRRLVEHLRLRIARPCALVVRVADPLQREPSKRTSGNSKHGRHKIQTTQKTTSARKQEHIRQTHKR
eukprot:6191817-Pleurochrysis_carterae.AAC.2